MPIIRPCVLNINKPVGWTSRDILNKLQSLYSFKKFGHAGTLDPLASGVLLVLASDMTKKQSYFVGLDKIYKSKIFFGIGSPTNDLEGPFTLDPNIKELNITEKQVILFLENLLGVFEQTVPFYSAVKVNGKELYKHARTGRNFITLPVKKVELKKFEITNVKLGLKKAPLKNVVSKISTEKDYKKKLSMLNTHFPYVEVVLTTGKGFYVRSLARDMGSSFKTLGVMGSLVRLSVGDFTLRDAKEIGYFNSLPDLI